MTLTPRGACEFPRSTSRIEMHPRSLGLRHYALKMTARTPIASVNETCCPKKSVPAMTALRLKNGKGDRIRIARERLALTQRELGVLACVSRQTINSIEHGHHASPETMSRIARALDLQGLNDTPIAVSESAQPRAPLLATPAKPDEAHRQGFVGVVLSIRETVTSLRAGLTTLRRLTDAIPPPLPNPKQDDE